MRRLERAAWGHVGYFWIGRDWGAWELGDARAEVVRSVRERVFLYMSTCGQSRMYVCLCKVEATMRHGAAGARKAKRRDGSKNRPTVMPWDFAPPPLPIPPSGQTVTWRARNAGATSGNHLQSWASVRHGPSPSPKTAGSRASRLREVAEELRPDDCTTIAAPPKCASGLA